MILENKAITDSLTDGNVTAGRAMNLSANAHAHIISMLTERTYKDRIGSIIRELTSNGVDSHRMVNSSEPVIVQLKKNNYFQWEFHVIDKGTGLDEEEFYNFIGGVGESNKQHRDDLIGAFGLGSKSPLSYANSYSFICRKGGIERKFIITKANPVPNLEKVYEKNNDLANGVEVIVPVDNNSLFEFTRKMKEQLCYFPNVYFDNEYNNINNEFNIFREEKFQFSELCNDTYMHITLDDVYYPLSYKDLGISPVGIPIALRFKLGEGLTPIPNREELIYTDEAKELILHRLGEVADWFVNKYNEQNVEYETFLEAYPYLGQKDKYVKLNERGFLINSLLPFTKNVPDDIKVKGIKYRDPNYYKINRHVLLSEFSSIAYDNPYGKLKVKYLNDPIDVLVKNKIEKIVNLCPDIPFGGKYKRYLRETYSRYTLYIKNNREVDHNSYYSSLGLSSFPEYTWKNRIDEVKFIDKQLIAEFRDETSGEIDPVWLQEDKEKNKKIYEAKSKALNKQLGDITISVSRASNRLTGITFDKKAIPITKLNKLPGLYVYFEEAEALSQKDLIYKFREAFKDVIFCHISPRELKRLPKVHNFKTMKEFIKSKPFARAITAQLIDEILQVVPKNYELIEESIPKFKGLKQRLIEYRIKNYSNINKSLWEMIYPAAEENQMFDMEIYADYKEMQAILKEFGFVGIFTDTWRYNEEDKKIRQNVIYTMMLFKKLHRNMFDNYELLKKEEIKEDVTNDSDIYKEVDPSTGESDPTMVLVDMDDISNQY